MWRGDDYEARFAEAPDETWCAAVQRRIQTLLPHARLVAVLRDPVERAHSNRAQLRGAGLEPEADSAAHWP